MPTVSPSETQRGYARTQDDWSIVAPRGDDETDIRAGTKAGRRRDLTTSAAPRGGRFQPRRGSASCWRCSGNTGVMPCLRQTLSQDAGFRGRIRPIRPIAGDEDSSRFCSAASEIRRGEPERLLLATMFRGHRSPSGADRVQKLACRPDSACSRTPRAWVGEPPIPLSVGLKSRLQGGPLPRGLMTPRWRRPRAFRPFRQFSAYNPASAGRLPMVRTD